MLHRLLAPSPREFAQRCAYALILLAPGSFVILPLLWLARLYRMHASRRCSAAAPAQALRAAH